MRTVQGDGRIVRAWGVVFAIVLLQLIVAVTGLQGRALVAALLALSLAATAVVVLELMHVRQPRERVAIAVVLLFVALLAASLPDSGRVSRLRDPHAGGGERAVEGH